MRKNLSGLFRWCLAVFLFAACGGGGGGGGGPDAGAANPMLLTADTESYYRNPLAVFNQAGDGVAVWILSSGLANNAWLAYYDAAAGTWSQEQILSEGWTSYVHAATDGDEFMVVWTHNEMVLTAPCRASGLGTVTRINTGSSAASEPRLASNGTGYAAVWYQYESGQYNVKGNINDGDAWTGETTLDTASGVPGPPDLASDGAGYAAVWHQSDGGPSNIYGNIYSGSAWGGAVLLESLDTDAYTPRVLSDGAGYGAFWEQNDGSYQSLYGNLYDGAGWSGPAELDAGDYGVTWWEAATSGAGYAVALNQQHAPSAIYNTYANIYSGSSWGGATTLDDPALESAYATIASNGSGYAVAWHQTETLNFHLMSSIYSSSGWSPATSVEDLPYAGFWPEVAGNGAGYVLAWSQQDPSGKLDGYAAYHDGSGWSAPWLLETADAEFFSPDDFLTAAGASGTCFLWYQDDQSGERQLFAGFYDGGYSGGVDLVAGNHDTDAGSPALAVTDTGEILAVWDQSTHGLLEAVWGRLYDGSRWGDAFEIASEPGVRNIQPTVVTDGSSFMVIYRKMNQGAYAVTVDAAGSPGSETRLSGPASVSVRDLTGVSNGSGYLAVWRELAGGEYSLMGNVHSGSAWAGATTLSPAGSADSPAAARSNGAGYAVAWIHRDAGLYGAHANVFDGAAWTGPVALSSAAGWSYAPQMAAGGSTYCLVWDQFSGGDHNVYGSVYGGAGWSVATTLNSGGGQAYRPRVASAGGGFATTWYELVGFLYQVGARIFSQSAWSTATTLADVSNSAYEPEIAAAGPGYAVAWRQYDGSVYSAFASAFAGSAWSPPELLETSDEEVRGVWIAPSGGGIAAAVLLDDDATDREYLVVNSYSAGWGSAWTLGTEGRDTLFDVVLEPAGGAAAVLWLEQNEMMTWDAWVYLGL